MDDIQKAIDEIALRTSYGLCISKKAAKTAISAMQELQQYREREKSNATRADRLTDDCKYRHDNGNCLKVGGFCTSVPLSYCQQYKDDMWELQRYREIGTVAECQGYKMHSKSIINLNSCNDCGRKRNCELVPRPGEICRINCYLWKSEEEGLDIDEAMLTDCQRWQNKARIQAAAAGELRIKLAERLEEIRQQKVYVCKLAKKTESDMDKAILDWKIMQLEEQEKWLETILQEKNLR